MLESQVQRLVYAVADHRSGAAGSVVQLARSHDLPRQLEVVSGIRADEARDLLRDESWFVAERTEVAARP
jgi:tRNA(adenine34) deaminase